MGFSVVFIEFLSSKIVEIKKGWAVEINEQKTFSANIE